MALITKHQLLNFAQRLLGLRPTGNPSRTRYWNIYALELEGGFYYIGITSYADARKRYDLHVSGKGAQWTKLHPPRRMLWQRRMGYMSEGEAVRIETNTTLVFIGLYGVDRVRGGRLCAVDPAVHRALYDIAIRKFQLGA